MAGDPIDGDFDPDPFGLSECENHVERGHAGWLQRFYDAVIKAMRSGHDVSPDATLLLLEKMGRPKLDTKQEEQIELLRYIERFQAFLKVPASDGPNTSKASTFEPGSFRGAIAAAQAELKERDRGSLNREERAFVERGIDDAYDHLKKLKKRRK